MLSTVIRIAITGCLLSAFCASATAQSIQLRGVIKSVDGNVLSLRMAEESELRLTLTDPATIVAVVKATLADIKQGTYLGSAAMPQPDGSQRSLELRIFPEQMRGTGEGHRPNAAIAGSTMTNGASAGPAVVSANGATIVLRYKDGEKQLVIPPNVPLLRYEIGSRSDLKAGASFTIPGASRKDDGSLVADRINVGRDGIVLR